MCLRIQIFFFEFFFISAHVKALALNCLLYADELDLISKKKKCEVD